MSSVNYDPGQQGQPDQLLTELEAATEHVIQVIVGNNTAELEQSVIKQVQIMKKLTAFPQDSVDVARLQGIKKKVNQQQLLIEQALQVTNLYLQSLNEMSNFSHLG